MAVPFPTAPKGQHLVAFEVIAEQNEPTTGHPGCPDLEVTQNTESSGVCVSIQDHAESEHTKRARRIELPTFSLGIAPEPSQQDLRLHTSC